jgi:hypothetical protein
MCPLGLMNVILHGKKIFAHVIKLRIQDEIILGIE